MKNISILVPTRKRVVMLQQFIQSVITNTFSNENVEILIRADKDDTETINFLKNMNYNFDIKFIIGSRFLGYKHLWVYYNELYEISSGTYLFCLNDDAQIGTKNFDLVFMDQKQDDILIYETCNNLSTIDFPILHRNICDIPGYFPPHTYGADWVGHMMEILKHKNSLIDIIHIPPHMRGEISEHIKDNLPNGFGEIPQLTKFEQEIAKKDALKIKTILNI